MLVKTNQTDKRGNAIYENKLNGERSTLLRVGHHISKGRCIPSHAYNILTQGLLNLYRYAR